MRRHEAVRLLQWLGSRVTVEPAGSALFNGAFRPSHDVQPCARGSDATTSGRSLSTSTSSQAKFQSVLRQRAPASRLLTRENFKEWQRSQYDAGVGARLAERAAARPSGDQRTRRGGDSEGRANQAMQMEALRMITGASSLQELRVVVREVGPFLDAFCLVAAISRLPRLARVAAPSAPGALWTASSRFAEDQRLLAGRLVDHLLPQLQPQLGAITEQQIGMTLFALGELSYPLAPEQQAALAPQIDDAARATGRHDCPPREVTNLMLGCAKLGLSHWAPALWAQIVAAGAAAAPGLTLQQSAQLLKALCVAGGGTSHGGAAGLGDGLSSSEGSSGSSSSSSSGEGTSTAEGAEGQSDKAAAAVDGASPVDTIVNAAAQSIYDLVDSLDEWTAKGGAGLGAVAAAPRPLAQPLLGSAPALSTRQTELVQAAGDAAALAAQLPHVAHVLFSLARLKRFPEPLFMAAAGALTAHARALPPPALLAALQAYSSAGMGSTELYDALCSSAALQIQLFRPEQLNLLLEPLCDSRAWYSHPALCTLALDMLLIHGPARDPSAFASALRRLATHLHCNGPGLLQRAEAHLAAAASSPGLTPAGAVSAVTAAAALCEGAGRPASGELRAALQGTAARHAPALAAFGGARGGGGGGAALCRMVASLHLLSGVDGREAMVAVADAAVAAGGLGGGGAGMREALGRAGEVLEEVGRGDHALALLARQGDVAAASPGDGSQA